MKKFILRHQTGFRFTGTPYESKHQALGLSFNLWRLSSPIVLALAVSLTVCWSSPVLATDMDRRISDHIWRLAYSFVPWTKADIKALYVPAQVSRFYSKHRFQPVWTQEQKLTPQIFALLDALRSAGQEGFDPVDYHFVAITVLMRQLGTAAGQFSDAESVAEFDLLATDAFFTLATHYHRGRVNPDNLYADWYRARPQEDLSSLLDIALFTGRVKQALQSLLPPQKGYKMLRDALHSYRRIAVQGGWNKIPPGEKMQLGSRGPRVRALKARLAVTGDLISPGPGDRFDSSVEFAVKYFQQRTGLHIDGVAGPDTLAMLNVPVQQRIEQIEVSMERWRWLPRDLGQIYVLINIAGFELYLIEMGQTVMSSRAVVGTAYYQTPVFSDRIRYLVLNPSWDIPPDIAVDEIVPRIRERPQYAKQRKIVVLARQNGTWKPINPNTINWSNVNLDPAYFPFHLRQEPGPRNPLGRIKFMFPNGYSVYLHDTPAKGLFNRKPRTFSHGCIRVEKSLELAERLLEGDETWTKRAILTALKQGKERTIHLPRPVNIHIEYWTAWVNEKGVLQFRTDIYNRDRAVMRALRMRPD